MQHRTLTRLHGVAAPRVRRKRREVRVDLVAVRAEILTALQRRSVRAADRVRHLRRRPRQRGVVEEHLLNLFLPAVRVRREQRRLRVVFVEVRLVRRVARKLEQVTRRFQALHHAPLVVDLLLPGAEPARARPRVVVPELNGRIRLRPGVRPLRRRAQRGRAFLVAERRKHHRTERKRGGRVRRRRRGRGSVVARLRRGRRRRGVRKPDDAQHRAVVVLHALEELEPEGHLVDDVGHAVARLRDPAVVAPDHRTLAVRAQHLDHVRCVPARVLVVVARVVPTAREIASRRRILARVEEPRFAILPGTHVTRAVRPGLARELRGLLEPGALVEERAQGVPQHFGVDVGRDAKHRGTHAVFDVEHVVGAGRRHARKVEPPRAITRRIVDSAAVPHARRAARHRLAARRVHHLVRGAG